MLGRYQGRNGAIEIVECSADGTRIYFEEGVRQSQATPDGESVFSYVKLMDELASVLGIEKPHVHFAEKVVHSKGELKHKIRELKGERHKAIAAHDHKALHDIRRQIHKMKRQIKKIETKAAAKTSA